MAKYDILLSLPSLWQAVLLALLFATLLKKLSVEKQPRVNLLQLQQLSDQHHNTDQDKFRGMDNSYYPWR